MQILSMLPDPQRHGVAVSVNTTLFRRVLLFQKVCDFKGSRSAVNALRRGEGEAYTGKDLNPQPFPRRISALTPPPSTHAHTNALIRKLTLQQPLPG